VTTLAVNALGPQLSTFDSQVRSWLLRQQYREVHPYTRAAPGGWAWTDLPGGVPDADDTSGALLALRELGPIDGAMREAAVMGIQWLLDVQNRDGGIPTFCRGWGALPFDRSSADITAHAIRAWLAWRRDLPLLANRIDLAVQRATNFLLREQRSDGSWLPLWFGNQWNRGDENPVYGTSRVLIALAEIGVPLALERGVGWLIESHLADGGWGARSPQHSSVEESALAVEALAKSLYAIAESGLRNRAFSAMVRGAEWLVQRVESGEWTEPSPIGFYFAKLWYYERLYPDPGMAPPGKHVMSIFVQYAPYHLNGGWTDAKREAFGDAVVDTLARYAPNIKSRILHRQVLTPVDIERITGLSEGNIFQGELALHQLFFLRPASAWANYRTPIAGYWQCGAGTHPGGGIMGASGRLAALEMLKERA
jgi:hypothetical protein